VKFRFFAPTEIIFGVGSLDQVGSLTPGRRVLIVCGKAAAIRHGFVDRIKTSLSSAGKESVLFSGVSPNPRVTQVNQAAELGRAEGVDSVIGIGGGSALDAAKAVAVALKAQKPIDDFLLGEVAKDRLPLVLIPTTAGTGSETSRGAILTDEVSGIKTGVRGDGLFADVALVDPALTFTAPASVTALTGYDIFTHAVETYLSKIGQPLTEHLALDALSRVALSLRVAVENGASVEARTNLSYASTLMGINLGNSSTCLPHRLQYPVGAITDTSHPAGLAAIYGAWLRNGYDATPEKWNVIGRILSGRPCSSLENVYVAYERFVAEVGLAGYTLQSLGIRGADVPLLASRVSGNLSADPQVVPGHEKAIVEKIYSESL
jgi:alcohol dehydrogenase class IV